MYRRKRASHWLSLKELMTERLTIIVSTMSLSTIFSPVWRRLTERSALLSITLIVLTNPKAF